MIAVLLILAGANVQAEVDVLAQSKSGKVLCSNPDAATKTCSSITSFSASTDGSVIETTEFLLTPAQPLTLTMSTGIQVAGETFCGALALDDLRRGKVRLSGEPLPADRHSLMLERFEATMGPLVGKKACDAIRLENDGLVKYGQVEGIDLKLPGKRVMWVSPVDGYKVGPR